MNRFERRAARGAAFLTRDTGGTAWVDQIDIGSLDLSSSRYCVLGQVYRPGGPFNCSAIWRNGFSYAIAHFSGEAGVRYGFMSVSPFYSLWRQQQAWERLLTKMKDERKKQRDMSQPISFKGDLFDHLRPFYVKEPLRIIDGQHRKELTKV